LLADFNQILRIDNLAYSTCIQNNRIDFGIGLGHNILLNAC